MQISLKFFVSISNDLEVTFRLKDISNDLTAHPKYSISKAVFIKPKFFGLSYLFKIGIDNLLKMDDP